MNKVKLPMRYCFLESLDTVRDASKNADIIFRRSHAKLEILISLLFGEPVIVPENVGIDSFLFTDSAKNILKAKEELQSEATKGIKESAIWNNPFILSLQKKNTAGTSGYKNLFTKSMIKPPYFYFSSIPEINLSQEEKDNTKLKSAQDKIKLRNRIVNAVNNKGFASAKNIIDNPNFDNQLENMEYVYEHLFRRQRRHGSFVVAGQNSLLKEYFERAFIIAEAKEKYKDFANVFYKLKESNIDFNYRGQIYSGVEKLLEQDSISADIHDGIKEIADDFYSRAVSEAVNATTNRFSISGNGKNDVIVLADDLAQETAESVNNQPESEMRVFASEEVENLVKDFEPLSNLKWEDFWKAINDSESSNDNKLRWSNTVNNLHTALYNPDGDNVKEAYHQHIEAISSMKTLISLDWSVAKPSLNEYTIAATGEFIKYAIPLAIAYFISVPIGFLTIFLAAPAKEKFKSIAMKNLEKEKEKNKSREIKENFQNIAFKYMNQGSVKTDRTGENENTE